MRPETIDAVRALVNAYGFRATERVVASHADELSSPDALWLLEQQLPRHAESSREHRVIATRLRVLRQFVARGRDEAFAGYAEAAETVAAIVNGSDWDEIRATLQANRHHALAEIADVALADLLMQPLEPDEESQVLGAWRLIRESRELGVEAAIEGQIHPRRGVILGPAMVVELGKAESDAEIQQRLEAVPEIAERLDRRREGQAQADAWPELQKYNTALGTLTAPADLPRRIALSRNALASIDRETLPMVWSFIALDLADSLRRQAPSGQAPMAEVIGLYRDALAHITPHGEPDQYVHAHRHLGDAYLHDSEGDQLENTATAIGHYETALAMLRPRVEPIPWATVASNLAEALLRRAHGDPTIDVDRAIALLEGAIAVLDKTDDRIARATARVTLAVALMTRTSGPRDANLTAAVRHLRDAADETDADESPNLWSTVHLRLGAAYKARATEQPSEWTRLARQAEAEFRLATSRDDAGAHVRAQAHSGLALALSDMQEHDPGATEAIAHYRTAIDLYARLGPAFDVERGSVIRNLALTHAERVRELPDAIAEAERWFRAALDLFPASAYPVERRDTLRPMATMLFEARRWAEASERFEEAIALSDAVLARRYTELGKEAEVAGTRLLYGPAAYCLIQLERPGDALRTIERGRVRMLAEAMSWKESSGVRQEASAEAVQEAMAQGRREIMQLEGQVREAGRVRDAEYSARMGRRLREAYQHLASLRARAGDEGEAGESVTEILSQIPTGGALVVPVVTTQGGVAIVVPAGASDITMDHVVALDHLDIKAVSTMLAGSTGDGSGGWLNAYLGWLRDPTTVDSLLTALHELAVALWTSLMGPVADRLGALGVPSGAPVLLMPSGWLGVLPLHAAHRPVDGRWRAFAEDHVVSYAPSTRTMRVCRQRLTQEGRQGRTVALVANPTGDLQFAGAEATDIAVLFEARAEARDVAHAGTPMPKTSARALQPAVGTVTILAGAEATRDAVIAAMSGRQYLHLACHGQFHWTDPSASGLRLASGEWLRIADILSPDVDVGSSRLVTLSACETGMTEFRTMPDEFVGLAGAFLEAGAPAVISSLWPVADVSTSLLMAELYSAHLAGASPAAALQQAQTWLRQATARDLGLAERYRRVGPTPAGSDAAASDIARFYEEHPDTVPFAHPYYWAGFVLTGAGG